MKKNILCILVLLVLILSGCNKDIEIWNSNNYEYSGSFVYRVTDEAGKEVDGFSASRKLELYNTSSDVINELWIWDHGKVFPLKSRLTLDGNSSSFKSKTNKFEELYNNLLVLNDIIPDTPDAANKKEMVTSQKIRCFIEEGKILPNATTSISGNRCDSIYLKLHFYSADVNFVSYLLPEKERTNPKVDEFAWRVESIVYNNSGDETLIISGHRYTGFLEDEE